MKILFSSNAIWANTGYGIQAKYLLPGFRRLGHEVAQFAFYGLRGAKIDAGGIVIYPPGFEPWGSDIIGAHAEDFKADLVMTLQDLWPMPDTYRDLCGRPWAPWFPVDLSPVPQMVVERARLADFPITYSRFGTDEMALAGVDCHYIPHGVNVEVYKPGDRRQARSNLGFGQDDFIIAMVGANKGTPSRKSFPEALLMFQRFQREYPEALLYLHTDKTANNSGIDFKVLMQTLPDFPVERVRFVDQYRNHLGLPEEYLADVYNAADVLLQPSQSEGFGIPVIEAQACGCPVLVNDCTSMPELVQYGLAIPPIQQGYAPIGGWYGIPDVDKFTEALAWIYDQRGDESARHFAAERIAEYYDWQVLLEEWWEPHLTYMEAEINGD